MPEKNLLDSHGVIVAQGPLSAFTKTPVKNAIDCGMNFEISPQNRAMVHFTIARCNDFARSRALPVIDEYLATVDLFAAHSNECPINFRGMFECPDIGEVMQFIAQVGMRVNRATGKFSDGWRGKFHLHVA